MLGTPQRIRETKSQLLCHLLLEGVFFDRGYKIDMQASKENKGIISDNVYHKEI